jgi:3-deoxy-D-manno-octulosonic-acid transferase
VLVIYSFLLKAYSFAAWAIAPWNPKAGKWIRGRKGLMDAIRKGMSGDDRPVVWMHCASLGEFEQGRPLLERIRKEYPRQRILLTFFSPSGYEVRKDHDGVDVVAYLPMDSPANAPAFLDAVKPVLAIFVKYEFWHYYLEALRHQQVPTLLVSAIFRKSQPFFKTYGSFWRNMLSSYNHIFLQDEASLALLRGIGQGDHASVSGDTRFDRVIEIASRGGELPLLAEFCKGHPVVVAGSTWIEDEETLAHYANSHADIRFVIVPHEPGPPQVKDILRRFSDTVLYSSLNAGRSMAEARVLVIDGVGLLARAYRYATVTYVGGGFGGDGVHNVLEAGVYDKPVVMGPVYEKFREAVDLVECGGATVVESVVDLEREMDRLMADKDHREICGRAAGEYIRGKAGATDRIMGYIQEKRLLTS